MQEPFDHTMRKRLAEILQESESFRDFAGRCELLSRASFGYLRSRLRSYDPAYVAAGHVVDLLWGAEQLASGRSALSVFLEEVRKDYGAGGETYRYLTDVMKDLDQPIQNLMVQIHEDSPLLLTPEVMQGDASLPVAYLQRGDQVAQAVALITRGSNIGTAFLIGPDLLLTACHVIPTSQAAAEATYRFNFQLNSEEQEVRTHEYRMAPDGLFHANAPLDYSLIHIVRHDQRDWHPMSLCAKLPYVDERVNIIHHGNGDYKRVSIRTNRVIAVEEHRIDYQSTTLPGASGAPVCTDQWQVVAMHCGVVTGKHPLTHLPGQWNAGTPMKAILATIPLQFRSLMTS